MNYDMLSRSQTAPTTGYPETQFEAANFFGATPPRQLGNGVALNDVNRDSISSQGVSWHAVFLVAIIVAGGYLLWHHFGIGERG